MSTVTHTFQIEGMHCVSCSLLIDDVLVDLPGVMGTWTSVKQGHSVVELDPAGCSPDDVVAAVEELGYTARLAR